MNTATKDVLFVDARELPKSTMEFVCWIDVMGSQTIMMTSIRRAANFLFKFHTCALKSIEEAGSNNKSVKCYPVMDGIYLASADLPSLQVVINRIFKQLANLFIKTDRLEYRFVVRGAIAYGPVIHGRDVNDKCCPDLFKDTTGYREKLLLGMPISQCYSDERKAPPFGVYMHDSAIAFGDFSGRFYSWWQMSDKELIENLSKGIEEYFNDCKKRKYSLGMEEDKIDKYIALSAEYFTVK
jgi:hypothetical protein